MSSFLPQVLNKGGKEDKGVNARLQCYIGAIALGDMIKTTLGPRGRDKILQPINFDGQSNNKTSVTNDGATILNSVWIDNPAAQILVDLSKRQDQQCGDGTTSIVVLAAEILRVAEKLVEKRIHPQLVIEGFDDALLVAKNRLNELQIRICDDLDSYLVKLASTTLSSKILVSAKEHFARLAVNAVMRLRNKNHLNLIHVLLRQGGVSEESYLDTGLLLERTLPVSSPKKIEKCRVLIANTSMDADKVKIFGAKVDVSDYNEVAEIEEAEKQKMREKVDKIAAFGCNVFINRQLVYDYPLQLMQEKGILCIQHADFDGIERLAAALNGQIISSFDDPSDSVLGYCDFIEEIQIGEGKLIRFDGCLMPEACTIVLRGSSLHSLKEAERSLHDAISIVSQTVQSPSLILGGGATEVALATAVMREASKVAGKKRLALEAYANALLEIPTILASNGGFDATEILGSLKSAHERSDQCDLGVDAINGCIASMKENGVFESYKSKYNQLYAATEAAKQIIRVDDIIKCAPRQRQAA